MPGQQELICGLSQVVTMAVLHRLNMEELIFELNRRVRNLDRENSIKERLVAILRDVMLEEYRQVEMRSMSDVGSLNPVAVPQHVEIVPTAYAETMSTKSSSPGLSQQTSGLDIGLQMKSEGEMTTALPVQQEQETLTLDDIIPVAYAEAIITLDPPDETPTFSTQCLDTNDTTGTCSTAKPLEGEENASPDQGMAPDDEIAKSKPFMCDKCAYRATTHGNLYTHMKRHSSEKPYKCNHCNYKTAIKSDLTKHLKMHTGVKPFKCGLCDYKTYRKSDVKKHMIVHTGMKPFKCDRCDYRTAHKPALTAHRKRHTNEKPYSCPVCDFRTNETGSLARHMRNKHE